LQWTHLEFVGGILQALKSERYDVVHNHLDCTGGPAVWASRRAGVPVISSFHNTHFAPQTWTRRPVARQLRAVYGHYSIGYSLRHSKFVTGCSQAVLARVVPDHEKHAWCRTLYYGVELRPRAEPGAAAALRGEFGLRPETPLVLHVGRFAAQKNHAGLLRVFRHILEEVPQAHLLLVGDGPLRPQIAALIDDYRLAGSVRFLGIRRDVPRLMAAADVLLFPSLHEGLPVVSLEAGGAGLPIVASDIPGTNEAVIHGETGFLHAVTAERGMAESAVRLLNDSTLAEAIRQRAAARVRHRFSRAASAQQLKQLYLDTLTGRPAATRAA
jgi:glycosyltransferase involved in cell wall biosynthesis